MKGTGRNRKRTIAEGSTPGAGMQVGERKGKGGRRQTEGSTHSVGSKVQSVSIPKVSNIAGDAPSTAAMTTLSIAVSVAVVTLPGALVPAAPGPVQDGADDVLDVDLPLLRVRLLREPRESLLEVFTTRLGVASLAVEVL